MAILTRETAGTGVTNKGTPLTNAEIDNNFIELVAKAVWDPATNTLVIPGSAGSRITGDFSNATHANRVTFKTSVVNGDTKVGAIPNGTSQISLIGVYNNSDPDNATIGNLYSSSSEVRLSVTVTGTGSYLPLNFLQWRGRAN